MMESVRRLRKHFSDLGNMAGLRSLLVLACITWCTGSRAALPAITSNDISPLYGKWVFVSDHPHLPWVITHRGIFDGQCLWNYQVLMVWKAPRLNGREVLRVDIYLHRPAPRQKCGARRQEYLELSFAEAASSVGRADSFGFIQCLSEKEFKKFKDDPMSAACNSDVMHRP